MAYNARGQLKDPMAVQTVSLTLDAQDLAGVTIILGTSLGLEDFEDQNWVGIVQIEGAVAASSTYISNKRVDRFYLNYNPSDSSRVVNIWLHGRLAI